MELPEKEIAKQVEDGVLLFAMLKQVAAIVAESLLFVTITATCLAMILAVARYNITYIAMVRTTCLATIRTI